MIYNVNLKGVCLNCGELQLINHKGYCENCYKNKKGKSSSHSKLKNIGYKFLIDLGCNDIQFEKTIRNSYCKFRVDVYGVKNNEIYAVECGQNQLEKLLLLNQIINNLYLLPYGKIAPFKYEIGHLFCPTCGNLINKTSFSLSESLISEHISIASENVFESVKQDGKEYFPVEFVAKEWAFPIRTIIRMAKEGKLITTMINNRYMFTAENLQLYIDNCPKSC